MKLTQKQEAFCQSFIETGNASEAYRRSYSWERMKPETVNRTAKELFDSPKIAARIKELQAKAAKRHDVTVDSLMAELEQARMLALKESQPAPMVSATMGKAKLAGLDKQVIEHHGKNGGPIETVALSPEQADRIAKEYLLARKGE